MNTLYHFSLCSLIITIVITGVLCCGCIQESSDTVENQSAIAVTDAFGNTLSFSSHPQRIAVAGADIATVLLMLGAEDQVIGVGESVKKDAQISPYFVEKASLGDSSTLSPEIIVSLNPDLLLVYASSQPSNMDVLKKTGVPIGYFDCYKQNRLAEDIIALGTITGKESKALELAEYIDNVNALVRERTRDIPVSEHPDVYFELGDYTAAANQSGGDYHITTAGGRNIAENTTIQWVTVTPEWIIAQDPDVIIKNGYVGPETDLPSIRDAVLNRPGFSSIRAVQDKRVYAIDSDFLYGGQSCIGLLHIAKAFYPEKFSDIDPDQYLLEFTERFYPVRNVSAIIYPPLPLGNPG